MANEIEEYNSESLVSQGSADEPWSSNSQTSEENLSWISWWCAHSGHEYLVEVPEDFIEDDFNMTGLASHTEYYKEVIELMLDLEPDEDSLSMMGAEQDEIELSAEVLYIYIHQRYICSRGGLATMAEKYEAQHFGVCPRALCRATPVIPMGEHDTYMAGEIKLYCPSCLDIYTPPNSRFLDTDGAHFGPTFPHLFFMTYPELLPSNVISHGTSSVYVPKIYGFKLSSKAVNGPKMTWLRGKIPHGRHNTLAPVSSNIKSSKIQPQDTQGRAEETAQGSGRKDTKSSSPVVAQTSTGTGTAKKSVVAVRESPRP